ncbi:MAG: hypothetical protein GF383_15350 [Candidatus Lokiarchaeota archaeon]|nr:hypothetical protein [Candidatus Lokiarchaeota archaeon]MBD3342919.1 hypothetical protein [Candidatus Lokiarchaeota archaeon]
MEKISEIKKEIKEKEGKEWIGLMTSTEKQLEALVYYLDHPKLPEYPKLLNEIIELYYIAKNSAFTKMEGIIRKLDQLNITLGKHQYSEDKQVQQQPKFTNYIQEIKRLKGKVQILLDSPYGTSLPDSVQKSLIIFINYLNHPDFPKRPNLFDKAYDIFEEAEKTEFMKMQAFKDMLNMLEIKLGSLTNELKTYKTMEERQEDLKNKKKELDEELNKISLMREEFEKEKDKFSKKKENFNAERKKFNLEKKNLEKEWEKLETEREQIDEEKKTLLEEWENLNNQVVKLEARLKGLEIADEARNKSLNNQ